MKNTFNLTCFLLFSIISFSQNQLDNEIIGMWKVKKVINTIDNLNTKDLINSFSTSTFKFGNDHTFMISTKNNSNLFKMVTDMINGKKWLTQPNSIIAIGSKSDNYNIMKILYKSENNYVIFKLYETNIELEVEKLK